MISFSKDLIAGTLAGVLSTLVGHPLDTIKVRMQLSHEKSQMTKCFWNILRKEGITGFFKGVWSPIIGNAPVVALLYAGNELGHKIIDPVPISQSSKVFLAGMFSAVLTLKVAVPVELIKLRAQSNELSTIKYKEEFSRIVTSEGYRGLYQGYASQFLREVPPMGVYFLVYVESQKLLGLDKNEKFSFNNTSDILKKLFAGGLAGQVCWFFAYPFDIIKTHIQVNYTKHFTRTSSVFRGPPTPGAKVSNTLYISGDYFNSDTRTILAIVKMSGIIDFHFEIVDTLRREQFQPKYMKTNPTSYIPMLIHKEYKVIGGHNALLLFLGNSFTRVGDKFYQKKHRELIDRHLWYFQTRMKVSTQKLTRMIIQDKVFGEPAASINDIEREEDLFNKNLLPQLEKQLQGKQYFCGEDLTLVDIMYYNEISTVLQLTKKEIDEQVLQNLKQWFDRMSKFPELIELDKKIKMINQAYNFRQ